MSLWNLFKKKEKIVDNATYFKLTMYGNKWLYTEYKDAYIQAKDDKQFQKLPLKYISKSHPIYKWYKHMCKDERTATFLQYENEEDLLFSYIKINKTL